jgi:hypothetical protein
MEIAWMVRLLCLLALDDEIVVLADK